MWIRGSCELVVNLLDFHQVEIGMPRHAEPRERLSFALFGLRIRLAGDDHALDLACLMREEPRNRGAAGMTCRIDATFINGIAAEKRGPHRIDCAQGRFPRAVARV